jgi:hypothetical protein
MAPTREHTVTFNADGMLECPKCGETTEPRLIETGYTVTHHWRSVEQDADGKSTITASGWDGSSSDVSEQGDALMIECGGCFAQFPLPEAFEVEWV